MNVQAHDRMGSAGWVQVLVLVLLGCNQTHGAAAEGGGSSPGSGVDTRALGACAGTGAPEPSTEGFGPSDELPAQCDLTFAFLDPPPAPAAGQGGHGGGGGASGQPAPVSPEQMCRCTRRPGDRESYRCPQGTGQSVTQEVGPEGGIVMLGGTPSTVGVEVELRIPPGALDHTVSIRITETSIAPPEEISDWSPLYHFEPDDLTFDSPVELRMPWASDDGAVPRQLAIYASETPGSCALAPLRDDYTNAGFSQGTLPHFGWAMVGVSSDFELCPDEQ